MVAILSRPQCVQTQSYSAPINPTIYFRIADNQTMRIIFVYSVYHMAYFGVLIWNCHAAMVAKINPMSLWHYLQSIADSQSLHYYETVVSIGSDNGLSPTRRQAIIWTNAVML